MERQKKNMDSKEMEDSPTKELNEKEVSKLWYKIQNNGYKDVQGTHRKLQGTEWDLQQYEKRKKI